MRWPNREPGEVLSRALERASRGEGSLQDGRHLGSSALLAPFTRVSCRRSRRLSRVRIPRERDDTRGRGDRDVRGPARTHRDGNNKPTAVTTRENVLPTEANRTAVKQAISPTAQARKRLTHREPAKARVLVRRREKAEVGPTHRAS